MKVSLQRLPINRVTTDLLCVFVHQDPPLFRKEISALTKTLGAKISAAMNGDFRGKDGETAMAYIHKGARIQRICVVGLGEKRGLTIEKYRRAGATAAKKARSVKAKHAALFLPTLGAKAADVIYAVTEGAILSQYTFDKYITKNKESRSTLEEILIATNSGAIAEAGTGAVAQAHIVCEATALARDLANAPGIELYPETLAEAALESAKRSGYTATVRDEREILELGMGGVIGVSQGSRRPPRFIIMEYGKPSNRTVVLVGKGVTFDTGGISIKPAAGMAEMKMDMCGAAAVIGTFEAVARLRFPIHLVGLIPAVENMPGGNSIRPGDILRHYNGMTSEVDNTDAEGRLILADALAYAERFKPAAVIDLATLTGACVVALGHHATGMMGNDDRLMDALTAAGEKTYERVWPLPLFDEYEKLIKSDVADVKNVGGRWAGAITAGWFLKKFIGDYKWVHLDIAGTAILEEAGPYAPRGGSGVGVRLLTEFLRRWK
jgi:leucyl aminopeptidase